MEGGREGPRPYYYAYIIQRERKREEERQNTVARAF